MLQDDAKLNLAKRVLRRKYTGEKLVTGPLEVGKVYRIDKFVSGDDFSNVGFVADAECLGASVKGQTGAVFKATATNPTAWTLSVLRELKLEDLKNYQELVFAAATRTVTVTSAGFEGGSGAGDLTFEKAILALAVEYLIEEFDPDYEHTEQQSSGSVVRL